MKCLVLYKGSIPYKELLSLNVLHSDGLLTCSIPTESTNLAILSKQYFVWMENYVLQEVYWSKFVITWVWNFSSSKMYVLNEFWSFIFPTFYCNQRRKLSVVTQCLLASHHYLASSDSVRYLLSCQNPFESKRKENKSICSSEVKLRTCKWMKLKFKKLPKWDMLSVSPVNPNWNSIKVSQ